MFLLERNWCFSSALKCDGVNYYSLPRNNKYWGLRIWFFLCFVFRSKSRSLPFFQTLLFSSSLLFNNSLCFPFYNFDSNQKKAFVFLNFLGSFLFSYFKTFPIYIHHFLFSSFLQLLQSSYNSHQPSFTSSFGSLSNLVVFWRFKGWYNGIQKPTPAASTTNIWISSFLSTHLIFGFLTSTQTPVW